MYNFNIRVELHGATSYADYAQLHTAMGGYGFQRIIVDSAGSKYHLPTAEYVISGDFALSGVLDSAKKAIASTGKTGSILVALVTQWTWSNLTPVSGRTL